MSLGRCLREASSVADRGGELGRGNPPQVPVRHRGRRVSELGADRRQCLSLVGQRRWPALIATIPWGTRQWSRIVLSVDPRTPRRTVAEHYERLRKERVPAGARHLDDKAADLTVHVARNPGKSWRTLCESWKRQNPERAVSGQREFARDAKRAWKRVVGEELPLRRVTGGHGGLKEQSGQAGRPRRRPTFRVRSRA